MTDYDVHLRAQELRDKALAIRWQAAMADRSVSSEPEIRAAEMLEQRADELDGTAKLRKARQAEREAAYQERMKAFHDYPPEVRAKQRQARINETIDRMAKMIGQPRRA
ncbi:hypothetical protein IQ22_04231 [Pseudomonas duriflava]|uniref:Uncharacterized protein n=1 Tax=Pseudomonas duriflava TaxID=459528 RepID=A0A562PUG7_9PSED|nr:hypothetical protein [Pseudomonas duriflava]TWI48038.1 hypothetical protein IQ22_04231 [Pseudomonas duriflava]